MITPNFTILYTDNPPAAADLYAKILGMPPAEVSPTFALFAGDSGPFLGLWSRHTVEPAAGLCGSAGETAFAVPDRARVDALYAEWTALRLRVVQPPRVMDFGYTFVVLDGDGHRLRVFAAE